MAALSGHTRTISKVVFSPDGNKVLTASDDGTTRIYPRENFVPQEELLVSARTRVTRELTANEVKKYLHKSPHE